MQRRRNHNWSWRRIPAVRRHFYVYTLLLLGAVVGNQVKGVLFGLDEDSNSKASAAEVQRLQGMKEMTASLYH